MARRQKRNNGEGVSITVFFDTSDPDEEKALAMAQELARKHGRRKAVIVEMLAAMYDQWKATETIMPPHTVGRVIREYVPPKPALGFMIKPVPEIVDIEPSGGGQAPAAWIPPPVTVTGGGKASSQQIAANLTGSMGSLFD